VYGFRGRTSPLDHLKERGHSSSAHLEETPPMSFARPELLQGTLELMVLKTLSVEPMHGWGIAQRIQTMSRDTFLVQQGSLYPALQRMRRRGWVRPEWRTTENNRRARYYAITPEGERELASQTAAWKRTTAAMEWLLGWQLGAQGV
jgi:transcriptional regulator